MKHYLLTWYGITDLRSALGFEELGGPVLGALRTGNFSDVIVLAYTDPGKAGDEVLGRQHELTARLESARTEQRTLTRQEESEIVDAFANTPAGHRIFKAWLKSEALRQPQLVGIRFCSKKMTALNDSRGIYDAVNQAMELVEKEQGEKRITFYLSPGTPVMAFTWAFVALTNPELDIEILSSSEPRKPPCKVELPYELLAPSNRPVKTISGDESREFDVIFHLFGEQRMPSLLAIKQFTARQHIFVTSGEYSSVVMKNFLGEGAWKEIHVSAFDPMSTKMAILKEIASLPSGTRVGFNLTGGTKLMFAGAIAACRKVGGIPFYFENREHKLIFLHDYTRMSVVGVDHCDSFLALNGFRFSNAGKWDEHPIRKERIKLTKFLWKNREAIAKCYIRFRELNDFEGNLFIPFRFRETVYTRGIRTDIEANLDQNAQAYLRIGNDEFSYTESPDFAKYLCGQWLEEYVFLKLSPLVSDGIIRDLRIGVEVIRDEASNLGSINTTLQEFDILFTDGKRLFFVECKAGNIITDHLFKLQQITRTYGGSESRGILAGAFKPYSSVLQRRIHEARHIEGFFASDINEEFIPWIRSQV